MYLTRDREKSYSYNDNKCISKRRIYNLNNNKLRKIYIIKIIIN